MDSPLTSWQHVLREIVLPKELYERLKEAVEISSVTAGQLVRTLALGDKNAGVYMTKNQAAYWDGKDNSGQKVSSGVYYYTLDIAEKPQTPMIVFLRNFRLEIIFINKKLRQFMPQHISFPSSTESRAGSLARLSINPVEQARQETTQ